MAVEGRACARAELGVRGVGDLQAFKRSGHQKRTKGRRRTHEVGFERVGVRGRRCGVGDAGVDVDTPAAAESNVDVVQRHNESQIDFVSVMGVWLCARYGIGLDRSIQQGLYPSRTPIAAEQENDVGGEDIGAFGDGVA